jgi:hypothetical protein
MCWSDPVAVTVVVDGGGGGGTLGGGGVAVGVIVGAHTVLSRYGQYKRFVPEKSDAIFPLCKGPLSV